MDRPVSNIKYVYDAPTALGLALVLHEVLRHQMPWTVGSSTPVRPWTETVSPQEILRASRTIGPPR